jgi:hypothetical protein
LRRLVLKELADNALDAGATVVVGNLEDGGYFVEDDGPGISPDEIATLFSINRPLMSSKLLRLPTRGALGNGLRVVAGAVLASRGRLVVLTRDCHIVVTPGDDGISKTEITQIDHPKGTRIEIRFGAALPEDENALYWAELAAGVGQSGKTYKGKTSPHWYDADSLFELFQAAGNRIVRDLIAELDGCAGAKAGKITADFKGRTCESIDRLEVRKLLRLARENARVVKPSRLGGVGADAGLEPHYAKITGIYRSGPQVPGLIPFAAEAWAKVGGQVEDTLTELMLNRTAITGNVSLYHEKTKVHIRGCGLHSTIDVGRRPFYLTIHVTSPYCPYISDGKAPDLSVFEAEIGEVIKKAVGKACRAAPVPKTTTDSILPHARSGRRSEAEEADYREQLDAFCDLILEIKDALDFEVSSRGWAYILEDHGLHKGEFNKAEKLIGDCRKSGRLPLGIVAADISREFANLEQIDIQGPELEAQSIIDDLGKAHLRFKPISFWDDQDYYIQMLVEKIDLKSLFHRVCEEFAIPLANTRGWSDINGRAKMMERFKYWEARGKQCVLLYCGDHDPAGLRISDFLRSNMADLSDAVGWRPDDLIIDRFGLNHDFIERHDLTWIDNLETGSGRRLDDPRHPDHNKAYVRDYIRRFGARKVEANALVVRPEEGRELCRQAILKYIPASASANYAARLKPHHEEVEQETRRLLREMLS